MHNFSSFLPLSFHLQVSGLEMRKWVDELFIIIMDMLQDSSLLAKRQVSEHSDPWDQGLVSLSVHCSVPSWFCGQNLKGTKHLTFL